MPKYLTLPDGNSLEVPDNVSYDQALAKAKEHFPKLYGMPGPDSGLFSALGAGVKSGLGSTAQGIGETTGLPALADYGKRLEESAAKTYQPTSEQDIAAARAKGFLPEAGAYLSKYITEPVGEAVGNIAGRYGLPTLAGMGAAAAAPEVGLASALGFAAANAPIHIGENIAAQKKLGQTPDYTAAIAAGIGQTAIDSLAGAIFNAPLKGILGKTAQEQAMALAPEVLAGKLTAEEASKQVGSTLRNIAQGTAQNAVVGTGMMVGNEALTRAATGQSLTSPEAQEAYLQNAKMGVGMSPLFGALHGMGARGDAETLLKKAAVEGEEARAKLNQKTEVDQDHPEYLQKIKNDYESAWEKYTQMRDALGKAPGKDEPPHLAIEHQEQKDAVAEQKKIVEDLAPEYHRVQKLLKTEEEPPKLLGYTPTPKQLPGMETPEGAKRNVLDLVDEHKQMLEKKAEIEQRMHNAAPEEFADLHNAYEGLNHRINFAEQSIRDAGGVLSEPSEFETLAKKQVDTVDKKIKTATDAYNKAKDPEIGNFEGARKQAEKLQKLQKEKQDLLDLHDQQRLQLAKQATGKGETLPLFSEKETPPGVAQTPEDAVSFDQPTAEQPTKPDKSQRVLFHGQNYKDTALRNQTEADRIAATPEGQTAPLFNEKEAPIPKDVIAPTETEIAPEIAPRKTSGQQEMFGPKGEVIPTKENVTPETISQAAETPEMRAMAHAEGIKTPEHKAFMKERNQQIADLRQSGDINGANALRAQTTFEGYNKAVELGKASSKYQDRVAKTAAKLETESNKQPKKGATKKVNKDLELSRGTATEPHTTDSLKAELTQAMGERVTGRGNDYITHKLTILPSPESLNLEGLPSDAKGVVLPNGKAYLFAKNINKGEGLSVLLHEVGTHLGFRNFFNKDQYKALAETVKQWEARNDNSIESRVAKAARARVEAAKTKPDQVDDEMLAYTVEEALKAGIDPSGTKKGSALQNWLNTVVNSFKNVLARLGLSPKELTAQDLVDLAYGAAHLELKGTWHGSGARFGEFDFTHMGSGEGAQAFGWGTYRGQQKKVAKHYADEGAEKVNAARYDNPKMKAWAESLEPTFNGKSIQTVLQDPEAGIPPGFIGPIVSALNDVHFLSAYSDVPEKMLKPGDEARAKQEFLNHIQNTINEERETLKVDKKLGRKPDPFTTGFSGSTFPSIESFEKTLNALEEYIKTTEKNGQGFEQPKITEPPVPKTEGVLYRTLHTSPEDHYLDWDAPLEAQSEHVKNSLANLFNSLNKDQKIAFNKALKEMPEDRRSGRDIIGAVENAMEAVGIPDKQVQEFASRIMEANGIAGSKHWDGYSRGKKEGYRNYVDFADKENGAKIIASDLNPIGPAKEPLFSRKADYGTDNPLSRLTQKVIAQKPTLKDKMSNVSALAAEMEAVDMRAALRKAITVGAKEINNPNLATQVISHIIRGDDKVQMAMSVLGKGPLEMYTDEKGLKGVQSRNKNSGTDVFKAISAIPEGNAQGKTDMATAYLIAVRALNKGLKKLDIGELGLSEKDLQDTMAYVDSRPAMKAALEDVRTKYNAYNEGQIKFLADTGAITKKAAADLMRDKDYVPFYRVGADGKAELIFNDNVMIKVGDIKNQPYLHALKGGETKILPLDQSMLQNTLLLTDKGLTNLTQKSIAYAFQEIGNARPNGGKNEMIVHTGKGPADKNVLRFTQEPDPKNPADTGDRWIKINTAGTVMEGVPDAMIMKSIEGTAFSLPAYLKLAGDASDLLRSGVTRTPLYLAHQLLRDPIAAIATGGVDKNPLMAVLAAGKNFIQMQRGKSEVGAELIRKGILHSQIFKGDSSDISKYALQLASGKDQNAIQWLISKADKMALDADASTRALVYQNAREKGMSEVEAEVAAREIVNYQKRGLSASVQHTNRMIPFMNGQIQALNSFAKAARGNMPFNDQLNIKKKFYNTALTLAGSGLAYGFALSDNPYYKNATLQDKYSNMFVFLPGLEEPIKIPVPYEVGYFFSLGAAAADAINGTAETKDQAGALAKLFSSSIPGYSSKGVPQVIKPIAEAALNLDLNYMQPLESARLQKLDPEQRITANTTELAKQMSHLVGGVISPIKLEHIVKGYLGQLPLAAAGAANDLFKPGTEKPAARITEAPLIGSAFQKKFGGGDENIAYEEAQDAIKAQNTFNTMVKEGRGQEAREYMLANKDRLMLAKLATQFQNTMAQFAAQTRIIQNSPHLTADQKRERLDRIDEAKQKLSANFRKATSRV